VRNAVVGIAQACVPDPDVVLHGLLAAAIADCTPYCRPARAPADTGSQVRTPVRD
jgi:hypothetical protein